MKSHRTAGRKYGPNNRLGFYRPAWSGGPPGIYLIVDNILRDERSWLQLGKDFTMAEVLFHEVGHHLNARVGRISGNEEASAEAWQMKLWRTHLRKRYWGSSAPLPIAARH